MTPVEHFPASHKVGRRHEQKRHPLEEEREFRSASPSMKKDDEEQANHLSLIHIWWNRRSILFPLKLDSSNSALKRVPTEHVKRLLPSWICFNMAYKGLSTRKKRERETRQMEIWFLLRCASTGRRMLGFSMKQPGGPCKKEAPQMFFRLPCLH